MTNAEIVTAVTAIAISMAQGKNEDEIAFLSAVFSQLGDTLATLALSPPVLQSND